MNVRNHIADIAEIYIYIRMIIAERHICDYNYIAGEVLLGVVIICIQQHYNFHLKSFNYMQSLLLGVVVIVISMTIMIIAKGNPEGAVPIANKD